MLVDDKYFIKAIGGFHDVNSVLQFGRLKEIGQAVAPKINAAIKYVSVANNTVSFFTNSEGTGNAAFSFNFPNELVLDQLGTAYENPFTFSAASYPGATDPDLEGKPVLVIAVKDTDAAGTVTRSYSFLNLEDLIDVYTVALGDSAKVITINGKVITFHVSASTGNHLTVNNDGLMVDVSDKVDKVANATAGNLATLTAEGGIADSGYTFATTADITELIGELFPSA